MISSKPTEKTSERTEYLYPPARINHASVVYKNKIYVWGGSILDPDSKSNPLYLYVYELDHKRWKRFWTKTGCKELDAFSGQCHAIINNRWYLFGGVNKDENYISQLWRLNLDSYEWIKCDQKN
jgi:N-acetylneuraminic acid mutarotase